MQLGFMLKEDELIHDDGNYVSILSAAPMPKVKEHRQHEINSHSKMLACAAAWQHAHSISRDGLESDGRANVGLQRSDRSVF